MHFYQYYTPDDIIDNPCYLAACSLIEHGLEVLPIQPGRKEPTDNVKSLAIFRQRPIHKHNVSFYWHAQEAEIAIMLRRNMEVIDVDTKNKAGLSDKFLFALKSGWQELYDKLVISQTPNRGLHILYYADKVGGEQILAGVLNERGNTVAIVERLNETNKSYIKCSPSKGYNFIKGNPMELPTLTIEERDWLCALGASFNEVIKPEVKKKEAEREDSPWHVFNNKNTWEYIWDELHQRNWECIKDLEDRLQIRMPGGVQHSGVIWKETNLLHIYTTNSEFESGKSYSPFGVYCFYYHDNNIALASKALAADGIGKDVFAEGQFWVKDKKKIVIKYTELSHWLFTVGYRIFENEIVKITNNIISIIQERDLKATFLLEVETEMVDYFYDKVGAIFSDNGGIMAMLSKLEDRFIKDTKDITWLFFKNYAVKITSGDILPLQYKEIDGYIWEESIIQRNFYNGEFLDCDAQRFVHILGGIEFGKLEKIIGYSISRYKDPLNPRAVIITEDIEAEDEGESQGGSGKGLLFEFIRQFRKVADFDGKNFKLNDTFIFQNVDLDTNIIFIDDVERNFKFNGLFSVLTNSLLVNKKNKPQVVLHFDKSPKIFLTSNYSVGSMDISSERRKYDFSVVKYFGKDYEPIDEFKRQFFHEWDGKEWSRFDNYIAYCCSLYLADGDKKHIGNSTANTRERLLTATTNKDFIDYMDGQLACNFFDFAPHGLKNFTGYVGGLYTTNGVNIDQWKKNNELESPETSLYLAIAKEELLSKIINNLKLKTITSTRLTQWIKRWATSRNVEIDTRHRRGSNNEMCYRVVQFTPIKNEQEENKTEQGEISEQDVPF